MKRIFFLLLLCTLPAFGDTAEIVPEDLPDGFSQALGGGYRALSSPWAFRGEALFLRRHAGPQASSLTWSLVGPEKEGSAAPVLTVTARWRGETGNVTIWDDGSPHGRTLPLQGRSLACRFRLDRTGNWQLQQQVDGKTSSQTLLPVSAPPPSAYAAPPGVGKVVLCVAENLDLCFDEEHFRQTARMLSLDFERTRVPAARPGLQPDGKTLCLTVEGHDALVVGDGEEALAGEIEAEQRLLVSLPQVAHAFRELFAGAGWAVRGIPHARGLRNGVTFAIERWVFEEKCMAFLPAGTKLDEELAENGTLCSCWPADVYGGLLLNLPSSHPYRQHFKL